MLSAGKSHELYLNKDVGICWECLDFSSNMLDPKLALHEASLLPQETFEKHTAVMRATITITPQREGSD